MLGWEQKRLADAAGVAVNTIRRMEAMEGDLKANLDTVRKIQRTLETAGIQFIAENGGGPGVRLKRASEVPES